MGNIASVEVVASVNQAVANLGQVSKAFQDLTRAVSQAQGASAPLVQSTTAIEHAHGGLLGTLREFRQEQVQQGRMARFYAAELASIIPAADGAKAAIQGILGLGIEGLAGGLGIGFAIEAVKLLVHLLSDVGEEAKEAAKKVTEELVKSLEESARWAKAAVDEVLKLRGLDPSRIDQTKKLLGYQREIDAIRGKERERGYLTEAEHARLFELKKAYSDLSESIRKYAQAKAESAGIKADEEAAKAADKLAEKMREVNQSRAEFQAAQWVKGEFPDVFFDPNHPAIRGMADDARKRLDAAQAQGLVDAKLVPTEDEGQHDALKQTAASIVGKYDQEATKRALQSIRQELVAVFNAAGNVGSAFGEMFAGIATGAMGAGKSIASMARTVVQSLVQVVTAYIASAKAAAAFSQAGIPIIGPILAVGAVAAMGALLSGLLSSAAGGFDVPSGKNPITQLHAKEMVLPAPLADRVRNMTSGGGNTYQFTVNAMDAQSFERFLIDRRGGLMRVLAGAVRDGVRG